jgi:predicted metal-dependent phosphotriesterase family hydrolase
MPQNSNELTTLIIAIYGAILATLGPKSSAELGMILPHEHVFVDLRQSLSGICPLIPGRKPTMACTPERKEFQVCSRDSSYFFW